MSRNHEDVVAAFVDGEPVDPEALDRALADAAGRAYLLDVLALRSLMAGSAADAEPARGTSQAPTRATPRAGRWAAVAAAVGVSLLGGYAIGQRGTADEPVRPGSIVSLPAPPLPADAVRLDAPEPTSVIRLEPGVNWDEETGQPGGH